MTDAEAALIMGFWTLGAGAIGYGLAVWRYGRRARRNAERRRRDLERLAMDALASEQDG